MLPHPLPMVSPALTCIGFGVMGEGAGAQGDAGCFSFCMPGSSHSRQAIHDLPSASPAYVFYFLFSIIFLFRFFTFTCFLTSYVVLYKYNE